MQTLRIRQLHAKPDSSTKDNIMISVGDGLNRKKKIFNYTAETIY